MSSVSASAIVASTEALNQVMQNAQIKTIEQAEKLMKLSVETAVGTGTVSDKGVDCYA